MDTFMVNGEMWRVERVSADSSYLIDRTDTRTVATTDPKTMRVYISDRLHGSMYARVLIHEIGHCVMFSYGLIQELRAMVYPSMWVQAEEWVCNFLADYGMTAFAIASRTMGKSALQCVPDAMASLAA